jgi:hypothetical protein
LWRAAGKRAQAGDLLVPIVGKFSEGFLTPDLKQAVQLVQELGAQEPGGQPADAVR